MSFQNFSYFAFFAVTAAVYLHLPKKAQTPFLLVASVGFYAAWLQASFASVQAEYGTASAVFRCAASASAVVFAGLFTWRRALLLATAPAEVRPRLLRRSVYVLLAVLALFKYYNFTPLPTLFAHSLLVRLPFPLGISFFTFSAVGYLADVSHGRCPAEKSLVSLSVFLFFFATITSGPICRGSSLLPQLHEAHRFEEKRTVRFLQLFALGLFQKVAAADVLGLFVDSVFGRVASCSGPLLLFAVLLYSFQLYFDFSGYSNMARASGLMLGISLPENFNTPLLSTSFGELWSRWHISLSHWFRDYVYIPLGGSRCTKPRHCLNLALTLLLSGLWHGSAFPFAVWGLLQAVYRVGEELLGIRPIRGAARGLKAWVRRLTTFLLWSFSLLFLRIGSEAETFGLSSCFQYLRGLGRGWGAARFVTEFWDTVSDGFYAQPLMEFGWVALVLFGLAILFYLDCQRYFHFNGQPAELVLAEQKPFIKWLLYYALVIGILVGLILQNGGFGGSTSFRYAGF